MGNTSQNNFNVPMPHFEDSTGSRALRSQQKQKEHDQNTRLAEFEGLFPSAEGRCDLKFEIV